MVFLNCTKAFVVWDTAFSVNCCGLRIPLTSPVTQKRKTGDSHTHALIATQPISLYDSDGVSPGTLTASVQSGDVVVIIGPRTTFSSARDPEMVLYHRVKHEQRHSSKLLSFNNRRWKLFMVHFKDPLPGIAVWTGER